MEKDTIIGFEPAMVSFFAAFVRALTMFASGGCRYQPFAAARKITKIPCFCKDAFYKKVYFFAISTFIQFIHIIALHMPKIYPLSAKCNGFLSVITHWGG